MLLVNVVGHADADVGERARRAVDGLAVLIRDDRAVHEAERVLQLRQRRRLAAVEGVDLGDVGVRRSRARVQT